MTLNNSIVKYVVVTPSGFIIPYSAKETAQESIESVEQMLRKTWTVLHADGYKCKLIVAS